MAILRWAAIWPALFLLGCASPGYHYETGDFTHQTKNGDQPELVWCKPNFPDRVPMASCTAAANHATAEMLANQTQADRDKEKKISQCTARLSSAGYVQTYSGELYGICQGISPRPLNPD